MKAYLDCLPCLFKLSLTAARIAGADEREQRKLLDQAAGWIPRIPAEASPPEIAGEILRRTCEALKNPDPYRQIKEASNRGALALYPMLKQRISRAKDPFAESLGLAIAGNLIDYVARTELKLEDTLEEILALPLFRRLEEGLPVEGPRFQFDRFQAALSKAERILYICDNAGEILFDRLFIEEIHRKYPGKTILFAVRAPAGNDALAEDAKFCGLDGCAEILSSGSDAPGAVLSRCSDEFIGELERADLVISKGQGNYESLSGVLPMGVSPAPTYFLFMIKCPVIIQDAGGEMGETVLMARRRSADEESHSVNRHRPAHV